MLTTYILGETYAKGKQIMFSVSPGTVKDWRNGVEENTENSRNPAILQSL